LSATCLPKGRGRILVDPLAVTDKHVVGLDGEQPPRRRYPKLRRDAKPLSRRAIVLRTAQFSPHLFLLWKTKGPPLRAFR